MEVRKGYKQTEVGVIPEDWSSLNLGKYAKLKARIGWQGLTTAEYLPTGNYYLITGTDFKNGFIDWDNCVFVEKLRYDQDVNIQIKVDDILVTKDGTIGKVAIVDKVSRPTTLNSGVFVLRPLNKSFYPKFLYHILMSNHFREFLSRLTAGSTISHLYQKDFVHYEFPLPPLSEQQAIAEVLSDTDAYLAQLEQLIAKKKGIKHGAMQELLKPKEGWEVKKLGELCTLTSGESPSKFNLLNGNIPFFKVEQLNNGNRFAEITPYFINHTNPVKANSIVFPKRGASISQNKIRIFRQDSFLDTNLMALTTSAELYFKYLFYYLNYSKLDKIADTTSIPQINNKHIYPYEIFLPNTIEEQKAITQILSEMDEEIEQLETKKIKAEQLKQGMMQELLTGKTRLI